jgi:queuine/archaeosine tRNA-ribosyltransferase
MDSVSSRSVQSYDRYESREECWCSSCMGNSRLYTRWRHVRAQMAIEEHNVGSMKQEKEQMTPSIIQNESNRSVFGAQTLLYGLGQLSSSLKM